MNKEIIPENLRDFSGQDLRIAIDRYNRLWWQFYSYLYEAPTECGLKKEIYETAKN
jgi:hypothetical protein